MSIQARLNYYWHSPKFHLKKEQQILHIAYHFIAPAIIVALFFRSDWKRVYIILMLTMLVDLDHLLATPIYDPTRCSVGFHPLHRFLAIALYALMSVLPKPRVVRILGLGLMIHMALDSIDCQFTNGVWYQ